jgi:hypothetical protein
MFSVDEETHTVDSKTLSTVSDMLTTFSHAKWPTTYDLFPPNIILWTEDLATIVI